MPSAQISPLANSSLGQNIPAYARQDSTTSVGNASNPNASRSILPTDISDLLKHSGASHETERKVSDLAAALMQAKDYENLGEDPHTANDPFSQLIRQPIDWSDVQTYLGQLLGDENATALAPKFKSLVELASPLSWQSFPIKSQLTNVQMGQAESWSAEVIEPLLRSHNLVGADLRNAPLKHVDASNLNFSAADLSGADLRGARLDKSNFNGAKFSGTHCVGPLVSQYDALHKNSDSFLGLLHPLTEAFASSDQLMKTPAARADFEKGPLRAYAEACKSNLLPNDISPQAADLLAESLITRSTQPNWVGDHQDLISQLLHNADRIGLDPNLRKSLKEHIYADPKVKPLLDVLRNEEDWENHLIGVDPATGEAGAVPAAAYEEVQDKLKKTPTFTPEMLQTIIGMAAWAVGFAISYSISYRGMMGEMMKFFNKPNTKINLPGFGSHGSA